MKTPPKPAPQDLLFEIGTEELPSRFVPLAIESIKTEAAKLFESRGLPFKSLNVYGTPRRLALVVHELAASANDKTIESLGPALAQAKDAEGRWTPAAQGFAKSNNTSPDALEVRSTDRGVRLCVVRHERGEPTPALLPGLLLSIVKKITLPKNMVWEESRFSFARPIRWCVVLWGTKLIPFEFAGLRSGRKTYGLRAAGSKAILIPSPARYVTLLRNQCVAADPEERRQLIVEQIQGVMRSSKSEGPALKAAHVAAEGALLDEVVNLVEHPVAVLGKFDEKFLHLPPEVLVTSMKKHQKFFPVYKSQDAGALLPYFIGIRNGVSESQPVVREGYERVLAARLADAIFFFDQDRKTKLDDRVAALKDVLFQKELGSLKDKTHRVENLLRTLAKDLMLPGPVVETALKIARLSKTDLLTAMVGEFPELQGVMGRIYAALENEKPDTASGIEQHYWPLSADGRLPETLVASLVALCDKVDTLAGDFLVGLAPTGSQDPYGLRRAAVGVIRIAKAQNLPINLPAFIDVAMRAYPAWNDANGPRAVQTLNDFMKQRWAALMQAQGHRFDEIQAVAAAAFDDVANAEARLAALSKARAQKSFEHLATAFKRSANILAQAEKNGHLPKTPAVDETLFEGDAERRLFQILKEMTDGAQDKIARRDYGLLLESLSSLKDPMEQFFTQVMVMSPDPQKRDNRLNLLSRTAELFRPVADFSCLQDVPRPPTGG